MQGRLRGTQRGNENANRSSLWGNQKKLLTSEGRMYLSVCVYPFSPHTKLSLQFRSSENCGERFSGQKCIAAHQSAHRAMRLVTKRRDLRPKYFLPCVAIHRASDIRPPPIYSFLPTSAPSSVTSLMGGHPDWSPVQWNVWSQVSRLTRFS